MLFMILLGLALAPSVSTSTEAVATPRSHSGAILPFRSDVERKCPNAYPRVAEEGMGGARPRTLGELPPGRLELAVVREIDGCAIPAVVREGIGGNLDVREDDDR